MLKKEEKETVKVTKAMEENWPYTEGLFETTPLDAIIATSVLSDADFYMFRSTLVNYLEDKGSKKIQDLITDMKDSMIADFDENARYNSIESFDGSISYAIKYKVLMLLYEHLWYALAREKSSYAEVSNEMKVDIMSYIGSALAFPEDKKEQSV